VPLIVFEWEDFLALAERLVREVDDESSLRTGISRAYYAAYHVAAIRVRANGLLTRRHTHQRAWSSLASEAALEDAARSGDFLRRLRVAADYRGRFPGDIRAQVRTSVELARDVIDALRRTA